MECCKSKFVVIPQRIEHVIKEYEVKLSNVDGEDIWPSTRLLLDYPPYKKGEFYVQYSSTLLISKLAPIYYLQHEFQVENFDPNHIAPILDGYDVQPYSQKQLDIEMKINSILSNLNYTKLNDVEMNKVICDLQLPIDHSIFQSQITVEYALFFDVMGVCPY